MQQNLNSDINHQNVIKQLFRITNQKQLGLSFASDIEDMLLDEDHQTLLDKLGKEHYAHAIAIINHFDKYTHNDRNLEGYSYQIQPGEWGGPEELVFQASNENSQSLLFYWDGSIKDYLPGNIKKPIQLGYLNKITFVKNGQKIKLKIHHSLYDEENKEWLPYSITNSDIVWDGTLEEFSETITSNDDILNMVSNMINGQFGYLPNMSLDELQTTTLQIKDTIEKEILAIIPQLPDAFSTNLYKVCAQANGKDLILEGSGKFLYRNSSEEQPSDVEVPFDEVTLGYTSNTIYSYRKAEDIFGNIYSYYLLKDGLLQESITDMIPGNISDEEYSLLQEQSGALLDNLPTYQSMEFIITDGLQELITPDIFTFTTILPIFKAQKVYSNISKGESLKDLSKVTVSAGEFKKIQYNYINKVKSIQGRIPNYVKSSKISVTTHVDSKAIHHFGGELVIKNGKIVLEGSHSMHPSLYDESSGLIVEKIKNYISSDYPFTGVPQYNGLSKNSRTTYFPDSWDGDKIVHEIQNAIDTTSPLSKEDVLSLGARYSEGSEYFKKGYQVFINGEEKFFDVLTVISKKSNTVVTAHPII